MRIFSHARNVRRLFAAMLGLAVLTGCSRWSCYELKFDVTTPNWSWFTRVDVTLQDEQRHPAFAWISAEMASGKTSGSRQGRWLVDDLWALARERGVDPAAVKKPLFIVRGKPVLVTPLDHCLVF
jgi:hypothetical protein